MYNCFSLFLFETLSILTMVLCQHWFDSMEYTKPNTSKMHSTSHHPLAFLFTSSFKDIFYQMPFFTLPSVVNQFYVAILELKVKPSFEKKKKRRRRSRESSCPIQRQSRSLRVYDWVSQSKFNLGWRTLPCIVCSAVDCSCFHKARRLSVECCPAHWTA